MEESPVEVRIAEETDLRSISEEKYSISIKDINKIRNEKDFAKVLIVDDNEFNRMILGEILKSSNILYNEVCTGKQAVDIVIEMDKKGRPYQILCDTQIVYRIFFRSGAI
ncbi:unnamed protein product [Blepharisma stoltei]|uniref:Response regulatory domain-containing protein n=1 Tax=Blepharisma stoltei TaxID=1481888 RepID=A0AAU9JNT4_9CILI|nr:unnamed protein product [Blepharisma stoltei]